MKKNWTIIALTILLLTQSAPVPLASHPDGQLGIARPQPITDLKIEPITEPSVIYAMKLAWTVPRSVKEISEYQLRYSDKPITEQTWESAALIQASVSTEAANAWVIVGNLPTYQHVYIGMKSYSQEGGWSALSNVVHFMDSGFRANPNGYQFPNYFDDTPDVTTEVVKELFGPLVCTPWSLLPGQECRLWGKYEAWMEFVNEKLTSGRSLGRASTSQHFYQNPQDLSKQFESQQLYGLALDEELRQVLARYQITQWANPFERDWQTEYSQNSTSAAAIGTLTGMLQNKAAVQGIVIVEHPDRTASYALTPVALEEFGGVWKVWVYNSNFDEESLQGYEYIQVNLAEGQNGQWRWIKNDGSVLSGDDTSHALYVVPLDVIYGPQEFVTHTAETSNDQVWVSGNASVLITNEAGERVGYVGEEFINEIDGASAMPVIGGSQRPSMPVFNLPGAGVYTIELEELAGPAQPEASIGYFSADAVITVSGIDLSAGTKDTLTFEASDSSLIYHSQTGQSLSVALVFDGSSQSLRMAWNNIALASGGQFELSTDIASQKFIYTQSSPGTYSLDVNSSSSDGEKVFKHSTIEIPAGVWHTYALSRWERNGMFWIFIDEDGDGKQDGDLKLQNQTTGIGEEAVGGKLGMGLIILGVGFLLAAAGLGGLTVYLWRVKSY